MCATCRAVVTAVFTAVVIHAHSSIVALTVIAVADISIVINISNGETICISIAHAHDLITDLTVISTAIIVIPGVVVSIFTTLIVESTLIAVLTAIAVAAIRSQTEKWIELGNLFDPRLVIKKCLAAMTHRNGTIKRTNARK